MSPDPSMDDFRDVWGSNVNLNNGRGLTGRLGASLDYRNGWRDGNGQVVRTNTYIIANLYQNFIDDSSVLIADTEFSTKQDRTWGGLGLGSTYAWADDKYAIYGEGVINTSLNHFAKSYDLKGTVGFRVKW